MPKRVLGEKAYHSQDSGKSIHDAVNGVSLIDLNRAGQGLLEIVTAPGFEGE